MKRDRAMKRNILLAAMLAASWAFAQAPASTKEAAKPVPMKDLETLAPVKQAATRKPSPKRLEDARHCLEQPNNTAIIKCAEEYL